MSKNLVMRVRRVTMKSVCTFWATLPSLDCVDKVVSVFSNPRITRVRFDTATISMYTPEEAVCILNDYAHKLNKILWVEVKGRQLRVVKWTDTFNNSIEINRKIQVKLPAQVVLPGGEKVNIIKVENGSVLYVDPIPNGVLKTGQTVQILARKLDVLDGYLTEEDKHYLDVCNNAGIKNIIASCVENQSDVDEILSYVPDAQILPRIESKNGIKLVKFRQLINSVGIMVDRENLYLQLMQSYEILDFLRLLISKEVNAVCAFKLFDSLLDYEKPSMADYSDMELMYSMGYRNFMLSEEICTRAFDNVMITLNKFIRG